MEAVRSSDMFMPIYQTSRLHLQDGRKLITQPPTCLVFDSTGCPLQDTAQAVTFLTCAREVPGSNLGTGTRQVSCGFRQSIQENYWMVPEIRPRPLPFPLFPAHFSLIILLSDSI
jgi:hypothetical protein